MVCVCVCVSELRVNLGAVLGIQRGVACGVWGGGDGIYVCDRE